MNILFSKSNFQDDDELNRQHTELIKEIAGRIRFPSFVDEKMLVYFGWKSQYFLRALGNAYFRDIPDHKAKILDEFREFIDEGNIGEYEYFIYLVTDIYVDDDDLFKLFTIAHELQHILRYTQNRCGFLLGRVLFFYFLMNRMNGDVFKRLPYEYDARRQAKIIGIEMYGKSRVDEFLKKRASSGDEFDRAEYSFLDKIDTDEKYDLIDDYDSSWNRHKSGAQRELTRIAQKKSADLTGEEKLFKQAYDYLIQECPSLSKR